MRPSALRILLPAFTGVVFLAAWYAIYAFLSEDTRFLLPTPGAILEAFRDHASALATASLNTTKGALLGFGLAIFVSLVSATVLSLSPLLRISLYPYLMILQMTPVIVIAPILVLWVGAGLPSVVAITFLICFFPLVVNTTQGLISTDRNLVELFRSYRATRAQQLLHLRLPAATPYSTPPPPPPPPRPPPGPRGRQNPPARPAADGGGLGFQALIYSSRAQYPALFATAVATCILGFLFVAIVIALAHLTLRQWHDSFDMSDR